MERKSLTSRMACDAVENASGQSITFPSRDSVEHGAPYPFSIARAEQNRSKNLQEQSGGKPKSLIRLVGAQGLEPWTR
jgi:hypothetical protein